MSPTGPLRGMGLIWLVQCVGEPAGVFLAGTSPQCAGVTIDDRGDGRMDGVERLTKCGDPLLLVGHIRSFRVCPATYGCETEWRMEGAFEAYVWAEREGDGGDSCGGVGGSRCASWPSRMRSARRSKIFVVFLSV